MEPLTHHAHQDGPRGPSNSSTQCRYADLDDLALLVSIIGRVCHDPKAQALRLLDRFKGIAGVMAADAIELDRACGCGPTLAAELQLLRALAIRMARVEASRRPVITSWDALATYVRAALAHDSREQFRALFLDRKNGLMRDELVSEGTIDHAPVYPREVVRRALELSASALVLIHNHPSGDPSPSSADIEMTRKIVTAARVFDVQVHDHLIVGRDGTTSFKKLGLL